MLHKTMKNIEIKADVDKRTIEGYAAVFNNVDGDGDVTLPGAFAKSIQSHFAAPGTGGKNRVKVLWQHNGSQPIGRPTQLSEDSKGLHFKARLTKGVQAADEALALIDDGVVDEMSFGFDVVDADMGDWSTEQGSKRVRFLKQLNIWEISPVTWGANAATEVQAKSKHERELLQRIDEIEKKYQEILANSQTFVQPEQVSPYLEELKSLSVRLDALIRD